MYRYKGIAFRPIERNDLELLRKNRNDDKTLLMLGNVDLVSSEKHENWFSKISLSSTQQWHIVIDNNGNRVGIIRFQNIDLMNNNCEIGADIFVDYRRKGFGILTYKMALEYLFLHFNMHMVYLKVASFNESGINLYKKIGFKDSGEIPESIYRYGKYWDNKIMYMKKEDFIQNKEI